MPGCNFSVRQLAAGPCVMSLVFEAWPYQGLTGVVVVDIGAFRTEFEISVPVQRTVDIAFDHDGADPLTTMVFFRPGLIDFVFHSMVLGRTIMSGSLSPWPVVKSGANTHPVNNFIAECSCHAPERFRSSARTRDLMGILAVLGPDRGTAAANARWRVFPRPQSADPHAGEDFHALV
jgi:hypothetical protein